MNYGQPVRMCDIAAAAGVDISTVSRALRDADCVNIQTRERINELAKRMRYQRRVPAPRSGVLHRTALLWHLRQAISEEGHTEEWYAGFAAAMSAVRTYEEGKDANTESQQ